MSTRVDEHRQVVLQQQRQRPAHATSTTPSMIGRTFRPAVTSSWDSPAAHRISACAPSASSPCDGPLVRTLGSRLRHLSASALLGIDEPFAASRRSRSSRPSRPRCTSSSCSGACPAPSRPARPVLRRSWRDRARRRPPRDRRSPASFTAASHSLRPRYMPVAALPAANRTLPGNSFSYSAWIWAPTGSSLSHLEIVEAARRAPRSRRPR